MKELQIYRKEHMYSTYYALVDKNGNYSVSSEGEESDLFTGFRQDGSWTPVEYEDIPAWFQKQIEESESFEPDDYDTQKKEILG